MIVTENTSPEISAPTGVWCGELELAVGPAAVTVTDVGQVMDATEGDPAAFAADSGFSSTLSPTVDQHLARVLIRLHGEPMGYVTVALSTNGPDLSACLELAWAQFAGQINAHLTSEGLPAVVTLTVTDRPPVATATCPNLITSVALVSVVVCTRNRSEILTSCLARLAALTYPHLELIIVDNAPSDGATKALVDSLAQHDDRFRYVVEPHPGLSHARNCGLAAARGAYIAYTDDDVAVDPAWVQGLLRGFQRGEEVGCVTGLACTAGISSAAEAYFDARSPSWSSRCEPELYDLGTHRRPGALYPYSPGIFGTGANIAFDRSVLTLTGPFDEALGAGTRTRGGEDLDIFVRVLRPGRAIAYEPSAIVWHHHRADRDALLKQMFGYGSGLSAFVTKCLWQRSTRYDVLRRVPAGIFRMFAIKSDTRTRLTERVEAPKGALRREVLGYGAGPFLYLQARRGLRAERRSKSSPNQ